MMVGRLVSFWDGLFSGAMLVSGEYKIYKRIFQDTLHFQKVSFFFRNWEIHPSNIYLIYYTLYLITSWPLVGNEGMNPQYTNVKVDSLIPY